MTYTYLDLINLFWQKDIEHCFQPNEAALYFFILKTANTLRWKNPVGLSNAKVMAQFGIGKTSFDTAKRNLKNAGLIDFKAGDGRGAVYQYLLCVDGKPLSFDSSGTGKVREKEREKVSPKHTLSDTLSDRKPETSIDIEVEKEEDKDANASKRAKNASASAGDFETFWNAYAKKTDREKCEKAWRKLSEKERADAIVAIPRYVAATPEVKYRKNPLTWLNGRCWKDEILSAAPSPPKQAVTAENASFALMQPMPYGAVERWPVAEYERLKFQTEYKLIGYE